MVPSAKVMVTLCEEVQRQEGPESVGNRGSKMSLPNLVRIGPGIFPKGSCSWRTGNAKDMRVSHPQYWASRCAPLHWALKLVLGTGPTLRPRACAATTWLTKPSPHSSAYAKCLAANTWEVAKPLGAEPESCLILLIVPLKELPKP